VPPVPGRYKLTLRAAEQPGELVTKNNQLSAYLRVLEGGLKVLYLEGELRNEQVFLRRSLAASADIDLDFVWIDSRLRDRWPVDLSSKLSDPAYDVFCSAIWTPRRWARRISSCWPRRSSGARDCSCWAATTVSERAATGTRRWPM
jgi:hypothetical protein